MLIVVCGTSGSGKTKLIDHIASTLVLSGHWKETIRVDEPIGRFAYYSPWNLPSKMTKGEICIVRDITKLTKDPYMVTDELTFNRVGSISPTIVEDYRTETTEEVTSRADVVLQVSYSSRGSREVFVLKNKTGEAFQSFIFKFENGFIKWENDQ